MNASYFPDSEEQDAWIQLQIQQQAEDQKELEPLQCDHEWEYVERLDKDTTLMVCTVCDAEKVVEMELEKHV